MEAETTDSPSAHEVAVCCVCKESLVEKTPFLLACFHSICVQCRDTAFADAEGQGITKDIFTCINVDIA